MYVYVYVHVCAYAFIHIYIHARVGVHMHSCRRILFICTVQSLYYMRVYHRCFLTPACVCVGGLEVGCFSSLFMVRACCWCRRLCFGRGHGRDRGFVLYISLFLRVLGWWVGVCLYTRVHTHKLLGYLMWTQRWPEEPRSTKTQYTCRPYRCTKYICLYICWAAGLDDLG